MKIHRRLLPLFFSVICIVTPGLMLADGVRLTDDPARSIDPYICSLGDGTGNLSVVWVDDRSGTDRIYMTRVSNAGVKLLGDLAVSDGVAPASLPTCGIDSAGNTHIVWKQADAVMYAKLSSAGSLVVAPFVAVAAPANYPYVDLEPGGNVHLTWVATTPPRRVKYRKLSSNGGPLGGCSEVVYDTAETSNTTEYPSVMAPGSGNNYAFVTWHGDHPDYQHLLDLALPYPGCNDENGPYWQTNDIAVGRTNMTEYFGDENGYLVFEGHTDTPLQHVYWLHGAGSYEQIDTGIGPAFDPSVSSISNSQVFVVWEDRRYEQPWVLGQAVDGTSGSFVGDNCQISDGRSAARRPSLARAGAATFGTVWDDDRHGAEEIYLAITGPACAGFEVIDPNPDLVSGGEIVTDPTALAQTSGRKVSGLAADGVTPVLLRLPVASSGDVTFEVFDGGGGTSDVGTLSSPGGFEAATALQRPTDNVAGKFWAFAILHAPERFVRIAADEALKARPILIRATFDPDVGQPLVIERTIDLKRPPVLLLHGLWGRSSSWGWDLMGDPRFTVYTHDYWQTNAAALATNVREARRGVAGALELIRDSGIAATQVDAFGHSMGGLLLRKYRASWFYFDDANLNAGDIHTLVTVDTPHAGSPWADVALGVSPFHRLMKTLGMCVTCGAIGDLRPGSSEITSLPETLVPAHAFVGIGGSDLINAGLLASAPRELRAMLHIMGFFDLFPEDVFSAEHDLIVERSSQEGGLGSGASQTSVFGFNSIIPPNLGLHIFSVTREDQVNNRAVETLNTAADDPATFASGFPAAGLRLQLPATWPDWRVPRSPLAGGITISSPTAGTAVAPGVPLEVTVTPADGFVPTKVLVTSTYDAVEVDAAPFTATLEVPVEATGEIAIQAAAYDSSGELAMSDEVRVNIVVPAALTGISTSPSKVHLFLPEHHRSLNVVGHYDDGFDRDVSAAFMGTTYISSDPSVVTTDPNGVLRSHAEGVAVVFVANGAFSTHAIVRVKPMAVLLQVDRDGLKWPAMSEAIGYDVIRGDLPILRATLGFWELAVAECLVDDWADTSLPYIVDPLPGESFFFLVRGVTAAGALSYDAFEFGAASQVGLRDAGIGAALDTCP